MSSGSGASTDALSQNFQLPPLRSLDDFVLGSARFQLPNLKDLEKWGNRVVKNLLYYQTNYFLMFLSINGLMIVFNPMKIVCGLVVQAMLTAIFLHFFRIKPGSKASFIATRFAASTLKTEQEKRHQKFYFLAGALVFGYILLHWFDAILLSSFTLLLPISCVMPSSGIGVGGVGISAGGMLTPVVTCICGTVMLPNSSSSSSSSSSTSSSTNHLQILNVTGCSSNGGGSGISISGSLHNNTTGSNAAAGNTLGGGTILHTTSGGPGSGGLSGSNGGGGRPQQPSPQAAPTYVNL